MLLQYAMLHAKRRRTSSECSAEFVEWQQLFARMPGGDTEQPKTTDDTRTKGVYVEWECARGQSFSVYSRMRFELRASNE